MPYIEELSFKKENAKILFVFIIVWTAINFLQAIFTGLYPDEAYYWIYSRHLQWGYFDHPPIVALIIKIGELFGHGAVYTRLGTVFISGGTVFFLYKALPRGLRNIKAVILTFLSVLLFHVYGFVATPDGMLFFFTALFFYAYRLYLKEESLAHTIFLALAITGMLYSKYHGVLPLFFTFLSNPKLVFKGSAWLVVLIVLTAFLPHLYWQYSHGWPTIRYHLSDRVGSNYKLSKTLNYILGQLLVWGPGTTIPFFYRLFKLRKQDIYIRAHQYTFWGVLLFFLFSSFKSSIEPHWTLVAGVSFILLMQTIISRSNERFKNLFPKLAIINLVLIFTGRALLVIPGSPITKSNNLKPLFYGKTWSDSVYKYAGNTPVVFIDSYVLPSLYQYYHPATSTISFNTISYRKNHFSISGDEINMNNKKVYVELSKKIDSADLFITSRYTNTYLHLVDSFRAVDALKIKWNNPQKREKTSREIIADLTIKNVSDQPIKTTGLFITSNFFKTRKQITTSRIGALTVEEFPAGEEKNFRLKIKLPSKPDKYRLLFSIEYYPFFKGTLASDYYDIEVVE